ncbi:hypothetical protein CB0101_05015 [Synechococcus sp. CB0101]|uniref:SprT-like domain-containing protein n=1 Tax=Synechococcus sp. CB0101 TaxID=232348 RepID=UPI0002EE68FD|nr:SprT-like domain-containing protein [Synechococcus sp. CB0101]QCH14373.1 hypothetical protein CB0101_05015 [Synechococcus sp. CB0101]
MATDLGKRRSPALEQMQRLVASYDLFNKELFSNQLPPVWLDLRNKPGSYGYFQANKWKDANGNLLDVISLDSKTAAERPLIELLSTLVHEMAHAYDFHIVNERKARPTHSAEWRREMERLGLPPVQVGSTWRQATHRIDPDGLYARTFAKHQAALQALPWQECIGTANRGRGVDRVKFQCPQCGFNAWAKAAGELHCGFCSTPQELVAMLPEYRPHGGGGKGKPGRATAKREHYAEPSGVPALPVYTDELGRELRLHTGLDYPPKDKVDALLVMTFGVKERKPELLPPLTAAIEEQDWEAMDAALKAVYRHRCQVLHPDVEGGSEVAFKALQTAYLILKRGKR